MALFEVQENSAWRVSTPLQWMVVYGVLSGLFASLPFPTNEPSALRIYATGWQLESKKKKGQWFDKATSSLPEWARNWSMEAQSGRFKADKENRAVDIILEPLAHGLVMHLSNLWYTQNTTFPWSAVWLTLWQWPHYSYPIKKSCTKKVPTCPFSSNIINKPRPNLSLKFASLVFHWSYK